MTANGTAFFDRRFWVWLGAGIGIVVLAVVVVVARAKAKVKGNSTGNQPDPLPADSARPPFWPTPNPGQVITPSPTPNPTPQVQQINYEYVRDLTWKMDATINGQGDHTCEITNGVLEMGSHDLAAFAALYLNWYGRALKDDYCNRVQSSGCWSSWWDGKHTQACTRLQST